MVKLWFVITVLNQVALVFGPLPASKNFCEGFIASQTNGWYSWYAVELNKNHGTVQLKLPNQKTVDLKDVDTLCYESIRAPELGSTLQ